MRRAPIEPREECHRLALLALLLVMTIALVVSLRAVALPGEECRRYRVVVNYLQVEEAAREGYVVVGGYLLEKLSEPSAPYLYLFLSEKKVPKLQHQLDVYGAQGFRVIPYGLGIKPGLFSGSPQVLLEKAPGEAGHFNYRVLAGKNLPALQMQMARARLEGDRLVGVVKPSEYVVIFEKADSPAKASEVMLGEDVPLERKPAPTVAPGYVLLETRRTSTLQKEINQATAAGYRLVSFVASADFHGRTTGALLEKADVSEPSIEHRLLATKRASTLEKEMNQMAGEGFRARPGAIISGVSKSLVMMERTSNPTARYQYLVLDTYRRATLEKEINEACQRGYAIVGLLGSNRAVLEREIVTQVDTPTEEEP